MPLDAAAQAGSGTSLRVALIQQAKALPAAVDASPPAPAWLARTALLLGDAAVASLADRRVLVVGMGGVGSWCAEHLARGGIGHLCIVDGDSVDRSNRNRQLPALISTEGQTKVRVMADRLKDINASLDVAARHLFLPPDAAAADAVVRAGMGGRPFDFVVDAIDSIQPKVELIRAALKHRVRVVSSMGAGGRLDPTRVHVCDLSELKGDAHELSKAAQAAKKNGRRHPNGRVHVQEKLGRLVRRKLEKGFGIDRGVCVVTSSEPQRAAHALTDNKTKNKASYYGTWSCVPAAFGLHAASVVLNGLVGGASAESKAARERRRFAEEAAARHG